MDEKLKMRKYVMNVVVSGGNGGNENVYKKTKEEGKNRKTKRSENFICKWNENKRYRFENSRLCLY